MKYIKLTQNKAAIVDDDLFESLNKYKWSVVCGYAVRNPRMVMGKRKGLIYMHREIMGTPKGKETDHINGNRLDNRKSNMRICTKTQNLRNVGMRKNNTSGSKGVKIDRRSGRYVVNIGVDRVKIYIGTYINISDAIEAYRKSALKYHKDYANI